MQPPIHKKSCPSTFRLNIAELDNLFHDTLGNTFRGLTNTNAPFIYWGILVLFLSVFDEMQQKSKVVFSSIEDLSLCSNIAECGTVQESYL